MDIKAHSWFSDIDFDRLQARKLTAPLILSVKSNTDMTNFDEYPEDFDEPPDECSGWDSEF